MRELACWPDCSFYAPAGSESPCFSRCWGFLGAGASAGCLFAYRFPPNHVSELAARGFDLQEPIRLEGHIVSTPLRTDYGLQFDLETERVQSSRSCLSADEHPGARHRPAACVQLRRGRRAGCPRSRISKSSAVSKDVSGKVRLRLEVSDHPDSWAVLDRLNLQYGEAVRVTVRLRKPRIYQNPGSFDFRRWMESTEDIYWVGTLRDPGGVERLPGLDRRGISTLPERIRSRLLHSIDELYPRWSAQGRCGSVLKAVLLGDRSSLDSQTIESFRKTGLYHLLVIAGLHVGLLALLADWLLRFLRLGQRARRLTVLALLVFYAFLVEQRAPTLRATLMIALYLLARLLYRSSSTLNADRPGSAHPAALASGLALRIGISAFLRRRLADCRAGGAHPGADHGTLSARLARVGRDPAGCASRAAPGAVPP